MAKDATTLLIERIVSAGGSQGFSTEVLGQAASIISSVANYAQIFGAIEGPLALQAAAEAQTSAAATVGAIAAAQAAGTLSAGAAAEATQAAQEAAATSTAETAGSVALIGGALVLVLSVILASVASSESGCQQTQEIDQLNEEFADIENTVIQDYWDGKWTSILGLWNSPTGGVGNDLDDLANEGTGGFDVKNDVAQYHANGQAFVNSFIPAPIPPGTPGADVFWQRPFFQEQVFSPQVVSYAAPPDPEAQGAPIAPGAAMGWYGNLPKAQVVQGSDEFVSDPASMLPVLLLGIQSYLTLEAMAYMIDHSQPTFTDFLTDFRKDLEIYCSFIFSKYDLAINGIVKTEIPSSADIMSFVYLYCEVFNAGNLFPENGIQWGTSEGSLWGQVPVSYYYPGDPTTSCPIAGYAWNGVYGAATAYPQYGAYEPAPPLPVPWSSPAGLIDVINTDNIVNELLLEIGGAGSQPPLAPSLSYNQTATFNDWTIPWVINRIVLGNMARWKTIYLINGYDQIWSIVQSLRALSKQSQLPVQTLQQDGMIANGNWSARELCRVVNTDGDILGGVPTDYGDLTTEWVSKTVDGVIAGPSYGGYSLYALVGALYNIGHGNWAAPPNLPASGPSGPLSFRGLIASAAV